MDQPIGDWGLASQAHEIEAGFLGNRRGFVDEPRTETQRRKDVRITRALATAGNPENR